MNSYDILYYCGSCEMLNVFRLQNILWTLLFILEVQILNSLSCLFLFVTLIQGAYIKGLLWARPELIDQCKLIGDFAVKVRLNNNIFTISLLLYPKTRKEKKIFFIISLNPELTNKGHWKKSCLRKPFINFLSHMILQ